MPGNYGKRGNQNDEDELMSKRSRNENDSEIRLLLPSKNVGAVIGKGGENIKRLRANFQARITLPDSPGPERLMLIRGEIDQICAIVAEVVPLIDKSERGGDDECDIRMLVHQSHAGRIIGKGGERIKELKEETSTQIRVYTELCPDSTDRCCQVLGKEDKVVQCINRILEMIQETPIKGTNIMYDPCNFDESFATKYGGYTGSFRGPPGGGRGGRDGGFDRRGGRGGRGGGRDYDRGGRDFGSGGRDFGSGGRDFGGRDFGSGGRDFGGRDRGGRDFGGRGDDFGGGRSFGGSRGGSGFDVGGGGLLGNPGMNRGGFGGGVKNLLTGAEKTTTSQVSIPKALAGAIIGKGGSRIRQVQMESGTVINIDDPTPDSDERIITIKGTTEEIQYAQYLLQMTVKQHAGL